MSIDPKELAVVAFYNNLKELAQTFIGFRGMLIDVAFAVLGYYKKDTWWGRGLLYGAVASLGREYMTGFAAGVLGVRPQAAAAAAPGYGNNVMIVS